MKLREVQRIDTDTIERTFIDNDGNIVVRRDFDPTNALKCIRHNKEFASRGKDLYHIASLPLELIEHWRQTEGFDWFKPPIVKKDKGLTPRITGHSE